MKRRDLIASALAASALLVLPKDSIAAPVRERVPDQESLAPQPLPELKEQYKHLASNGTYGRWEFVGRARPDEDFTINFPDESEALQIKILLEPYGLVMPMHRFGVVDNTGQYRMYVYETAIETTQIQIQLLDDYFAHISRTAHWAEQRRIYSTSWHKATTFNPAGYWKKHAQEVMENFEDDPIWARWVAGDPEIEW